VSLLDGLGPPPGAPGAVRVGAACWRGTADRLQEVADHLRSRSAALGSTWSGPAKDAFTAMSGPLLDAMGSAAGLLRDLAHQLEEHADAIEHAQDEYHQCMAAVGITVGVGILLTPVTAGVSDGVAAGVAGGEVAAATAIAATATQLLLAALSDVAAQAVALAGRWALLFGAAVAADAASGMITYRDLNPLDHLHLEQDAQYALVGGLAVPIGARLLAGLGDVAGGSLVTGATGTATRFAVGGISTASADVLVRAALGQGVDPGALVLAGLPIGPAGRPVGPRPPLREIPMGFADAQEFRAFGEHLGQGLHAAGYRDVVPVFQGSSVTGVKYRTGVLFDVGRTSDFDIALASPSLFERAKALGVQIRGRGSRTAPLTDEELLKTLGLHDLSVRLSDRMGGRPVFFMIYKDLDVALRRSPSIEVK
jgi:WXG100 family type VII secretion target